MAEVRIGENHRAQLERQYTAEDHAGHRWTFSETLADVAPEEWGGTSVPLSRGGAAPDSSAQLPGQQREEHRIASVPFRMPQMRSDDSLSPEADFLRDSLGGEVLDVGQEVKSLET